MRAPRAIDDEYDGGLWLYRETTTHNRRARSFPWTTNETSVELFVEGEQIILISALQPLINGPQDFRDLLWQFRNNAGFISGRLKSESHCPVRFRSLTLCILSVLYRGPSASST